jgi:uncharacterized protein (TIGR02145 family)
MGFKPLFITCLILFLGLVSCDSTTNVRLVGEAQPIASEIGEESGSVQLRMALASPGFLARAQAVPRYRIERVIIRLYRDEETLPLVLDTLSVNDPFYFQYSRKLDIRSTWIVQMKALDSAGKVRYEGEESFQPKLNETTQLTVTLHPKEFEMRLMMRGFNGLRQVDVSVGNYYSFSWTFDSTIRTGDSLLLSHEFKPDSWDPGAPSSSRRVVVSVYGSKSGTKTELFNCDTNLRVRYGQDSIVRLNLKWVGDKFPIDTVKWTNVAAVVPNQPMYFGLEYPKNFLPVGDTGVFTDLRDGRSYGFKRFGEVIWMTENLRYGCDTCGIAGARYTNPTYVAGVCPMGWRIPHDDDWKKLIEIASLGGGARQGLIHLLSPNWFSGEQYCGYENPANYPEGADLVWSCGGDMGGEAVGGDDSTGFHLLPTDLVDWSGGNLSTSYEYGSMWSRREGGMSSISISHLSHNFYPVTEWSYNSNKGIRCVTD